MSNGGLPGGMQVADACALAPGGQEVLLDLFCGTGTIGLTLASQAKEVWGCVPRRRGGASLGCCVLPKPAVSPCGGTRRCHRARVRYELVPEAVEDARRNAAINGISNAHFRQGDLSKLAAEIGQEVPSPDVVITDPNRPGMSASLVAWLRGCGARRIVYVSCNPSTQARDMQMLVAGSTDHGEDGAGAESTGPYRLVSVTPVDMFPHTPHVESVAVLDRCD